MALGHYMLAAAHPAVLLDGYPLGANGDRAFCDDCRRELRDGHRATVLAYRLADTKQWDVPRVYCEVCSPQRLVEPCDEAAEILARGDVVAGEGVGDSPGRLHLSDVDVLDYSEPAAGAV